MKRFTRSWPKLIGLLIIAVVYSIGTAFGQGFSPQTQNKLQQVLQSFQNDPSFVGGISASINVDGLGNGHGAVTAGIEHANLAVFSGLGNCARKSFARGSAAAGV